MTLNDYVVALRRGWIIILVSFAVAVVAAAALVLRQPDVYTSTTQLYVSSPGSEEDGVSGSDRDDLAAGRAISFATVLAGNVALDQVRAEVGGSGDESVSVNALLNTVVIEVRVTSSDPQRAADVAQGYADVAPEVLEGLETDRRGRPAVKVTTIAEPGVPSAPDAVSRVPTLAAAGILGLGLGLSIVLVRETLRRERSGASAGAARSDHQEASS